MIKPTGNNHHHCLLRGNAGDYAGFVVGWLMLDVTGNTYFIIFPQFLHLHPQHPT
jgi:hypothetical protein